MCNCFCKMRMPATLSSLVFAHICARVSVGDQADESILPVSAIPGATGGERWVVTKILQTCH